MAKEEYETPLIDVYNRTHMDALHEDGSWYHGYLPEGVFLEDLGQIIEEELTPFGIIDNGFDPDENSIPGDSNVWSPAGDRNQFEYY